VAGARAVIVVDHGSRRAEANAQLEWLVEELRRRLPGSVVELAHLEIAPPSLGAAIDGCVARGVREIVVHPFFLSAGTHSSRDIPREVEQACARHAGVTVRVTPPLGPDPKLVELALERIRDVV
jgi:sirohydrochlorin ferrochelatase